MIKEGQYIIMTLVPFVMGHLSDIPIFPTIAVAIDVTDVVYKTVVSDAYLRNNKLGTDDIKRVLGAFVKIEQFELERDAGLRAWEIYGYYPLVKEI